VPSPPSIIPWVLRGYLADFKKICSPPLCPAVPVVWDPCARPLVGAAQRPPLCKSPQPSRLEGTQRIFVAADDRNLQDKINFRVIVYGLDRAIYGLVMDPHPLVNTPCGISNLIRKFHNTSLIIAGNMLIASPSSRQVPLSPPIPTSHRYVCENASSFLFVRHVLFPSQRSEVSRLE